MSAMRTRLPPNVTRERNRHGTVVYYYRVAKGPRLRLPAYGAPEFEAAYQAAIAGQPYAAEAAQRSTIKGSLKWLIGEYRQSLHWRGLDPVTRKRRESFFADMIATAGHTQISQITPATIIRGRDRRTGGKGHAANNFLKAIKPLFAFAAERGLIASDPAKPVAFVKPIRGTRAAWDFADVARYEARHPLGTMANLALRILLFTGLRRSDAVQLGRQHIRNGVVHFRPSKTAGSSGVAVTFTALPPLLEAIEATPTGDLTLLQTEAGTPFASGASFGNWFRDRCKEAGVDARAHGLRKTGPAMAAEFGATASELMAMWGWTTMAQAELYTRSASRAALGNAAAAKLMAGYTAQTANNIPRTLDAGAGTSEKDK